METQRQWNVTLMVHERIEKQPFLIKTTAWYRKEKPTFSDALAWVRRTIWDTFCISSGHDDMQKVPHNFKPHHRHHMLCRLIVKVELKCQIAPQFSVIIPVYNEEKRIGSTLSNIVSYFDQSEHSYEIIVVNDGSTDGTLSIIQNMTEQLPNFKIIDNKQNRGKGYAVRCGLLAGTGRYRLFTDADLSTPIEEIEHLLCWLREGYDICIASRSLPESNIGQHQPFYREWMGITFNRIVRLTLFLPYMDTQCGFKCLRNEVVEQLMPLLRVNRFGFDVEMLYVAKILGYKIKEIGVSWVNSHTDILRNDARSFCFLQIFLKKEWGSFRMNTLSMLLP